MATAQYQIKVTPVDGLTGTLPPGTKLANIGVIAPLGAVLITLADPRLRLGGAHPNLTVLATTALPPGTYGGSVGLSAQAFSMVIAGQPPVDPPPPTGAFPGQAGNPVGYASASGYSGSLSNAVGTIGTSGQTYRFMNFAADYVDGPNNTFIGCRFRSNSVSSWNTIVRGAGNKFLNCSFTPLDGVVIPHPKWPSAGAGENTRPNDQEYQIPYGSGYQYGLRVMASGLVVDHCDIWGFGNAIDLHADDFTITDTWIHDASWEGPNAEYHTDGPGYLDGGNGGVRNGKILRCTIASLGNTNALAFQAGNRYSNLEVDGNYFSGFGYTIDMCHGITGATGLKFTNNTVTREVKPVWGPVQANHVRTFPRTGTANLWRGNKDGTGKFLLPDGSSSTTDWMP